MGSSWINNFIIYCDNLSFYYIFSVALSFFAVVLAWWWHESKQTEFCASSTSEFDESEDKTEPMHLLSKLRTARQEAIEKEISAGLTEQQLQQERETEQAQLAAILQLLQEQEDKFQVTSMKELQDQLKLYRR